VSARGTISIVFPRWGIHAVGAWLYAHGPYSPEHNEWPRASRIAKKLWKCARRQRRDWTVTLERIDAEWLAHRLPTYPRGSTILYRSWDPVLDYAVNFGADLRWYLKRKSGRPAHSFLRLGEKLRANRSGSADSDDHTRQMKRWRSLKRKREPQRITLASQPKPSVQSTVLGT